MQTCAPLEEKCSYDSERSNAADTSARYSAITRVHPGRIRSTETYLSLTLHRWFEHECNGVIQRDGDDGDGRPFWYNTDTGRKLGPVPDRERGALRRLKAIIDERNLRETRAVSERSLRALLTYYIQGDPRGAVLYIIRPGDVPEGADVSSYYTRGICVY